MITSIRYPKQLTRTEEEALTFRCCNGDTEARNILIEHNLRLVVHIAKKFYSTGYSQDELVSVGSVGLIKAVSSYNTEKGTRLSTYAVKCIENEILMFMRADKRHREEVSLQDTIGQDSEGNEITFMDLLPAQDSEDFVDSIDRLIRTEKLNRKMPAVLREREKRIIELRYGLRSGRERTQKEIGKMLGISRSYVSRIEKSALKKLKSALQN